MTLTSSTNPATVGQAVAFTATVTGTQGADVATGIVTFLEGTTVLGTGSLNEAGLATFSTSSLAQGDHTIVGSYAGDGSFDGSNSSPFDVMIDGAALKLTTTILSVSTTSVASDQQVVLTAIVTAVTAPGGSPPTGFVTFKVDGMAQPPSVLSVLNQHDQATLTLTSLAAGTHVVTAAYDGGAAFTASASADSASIVVTALAVPTAPRLMVPL